MEEKSWRGRISWYDHHRRWEKLEKEERRGGGRIGFAANVENGKLWTGALTARQLFTKPFKSSHRQQWYHISMTPPSIIGFVFVFVKKRGKEEVELDVQRVLGGWEWEIRDRPARPSQNPDPSYHRHIVIIPPSYHNELGRNKGMRGVENGKL